METSSNPVPFVCPCCHKKTTGYQRKDGAILVVCHRCKAKITYQNPYFNSRFGRSDFEEINTESDLSEMMRYIMKYMEKTGERLVYSKGLPQFFISDIMDEDIAGPIGMEDKKLLLFDDFTCWDEGCYIGKVSPEVIAQMRKVN